VDSIPVEGVRSFSLIGRKSSLQGTFFRVKFRVGYGEARLVMTQALASVTDRRYGMALLQGQQLQLGVEGVIVGFFLGHPKWAKVPAQLWFFPLILP